ncbi:hypothetical protein BDQ17DRAFT_1431507 [Cyathus striatus]|nr:hypothetical protein BDQ17DRAFT_1431507 [Cyathus striatus]
MFRTSPPIFDLPEYPHRRRVKPLPKRRRTSASSSPPTLSTQLPISPLDILGPDATPEEILQHTDALSARMARYCMPYYFDGEGMDPGGGGGLKPGGAGSPDLGGIDFGAQFSAFAGAVAGAGMELAGALASVRAIDVRDDDDEHGDEDYIDHLQQPGNTKKRKVPANASNSPRGGHDVAASAQSDELQVESGIGIPTRMEGDQVEEPYTPPPITNFGAIGRKKGKLTAVTLAGMQHKDIINNRKVQLSTILGPMSLINNLALDLALSSIYHGFDDLKNTDAPKVRLSKRDVIRSARVARLSRLPPHPDAVPMPSGDFSFTCNSATGDRFITTNAEAAVLSKRIKAEQERQAEKAAKLAAANKASSQHASSKGSRRSKRVQQRARTITSGKGAAGEQTAEFLDHSNGTGNEGVGGGGGGGGVNAGGGQAAAGVPMNTANANSKSRGGGKKKKRSALANASNPHHLRNYVPSRLPHSGSGAHGNANHANGPNGKGENWLSPLPLKFLSAEIAPRRKKRQTQTQNAAGVGSTTALTNPADEWICAYCEFELFYGDDAQYKRAIRNRKKILKRRRRARERAAAAASGNSTLKTQEKPAGGEGEYEEGFDVPGMTPSAGVLRGHPADRAAAAPLSLDEAPQCSLPTPHSPPQPAHYPHPQHPQHPPPSYPQTYAPTTHHYISQQTAPPPPPPPQAAPQPTQWSNEQHQQHWAHYNQYPPQPPPPAQSAHVEQQQQPPFSSGPGRPETIPPSVTPHNNDHRGYGPPPPSSADSRRAEERQPAAPPPPSSHSKPRRQELESPPAPPPALPTVQSGLDFRKLLDSYRIIMDAADTLKAPGALGGSGHGRPTPAAEALERMLQSASYGVHMLEAAATPQSQSTPSSDTRPSPKEKEPEDVKEPLGSSTSAPPPPSKRQIKKRFKEKNITNMKKANGQAVPNQGHGDDSGEGASEEDDDDYRSQGHRSEFGDPGRRD